MSQDTRPLFISESDVHDLVDMRSAIDALKSSFREQAAGDALNSPRTRARYWGSRLNIMSAGQKSGRFGFKAYAGTRAPTVYHVMLYDSGSGLIAIIEARRLSRLRTGAATGVATELLAKQEPIKLALIGAGEQARTQLEAIAAVRRLSACSVYARNRENLVAFCNAVSKELGIDLTPAAKPEECVSGADVIVTATNSQTPVVLDEWIGEGTHINTIGANAANRMELEPITFERAKLVVTDDIDQARIEAGELIRCAEGGRLTWNDVSTLANIVADPPRQRAGLSIFKSLGAAIEDVAVASAVYDMALAQGRGTKL